MSRRCQLAYLGRALGGSRLRLVHRLGESASTLHDEARLLGLMKCPILSDPPLRLCRTIGSLAQRFRDVLAYHECRAPRLHLGVVVLHPSEISRGIHTSSAKQDNLHFILLET